MNELSNHETALELLQQLGLKEYESKAFVALSRLPHGTAKQISEAADIPRTRVYDAVRVLETKGLVEVQHTNPQQFRAVSIDEAVETLRDEYESRVDSLREALRSVEPLAEDDSGSTHEVWSLSGQAAIRSRTEELVEEATSELVLVVGHAAMFTDELRDRLQAAQGRGVTLIVGVVSESLRDRVEAALPEAEVFVSGLDWLQRPTPGDDETEIGGLLLIDRNTILVNTLREPTDGGHPEAQAVFGRGFDNGFVAIVRRLMETGLLPGDDPRGDDPGDDDP